MWSWRRLLILTALLSLSLASCSREAQYPSRAITILCPWSIGGGTDAMSRQLALFLRQELDAPAVNVINATGGGGVTGHSRGARARPDGYTLTMMTVELNMLRWRKLTKIQWEDFEPIMLLNREAAAIFVRTDSPWKSLEDLTAAVQKDPGKFTASGTSIGGIWHLALAGWLNNAGLGADAIKWIPTTGAGPSIQELLSGGLDIVCCSVPEARSPMENGQVRCLGVMSEERKELFPDIPTFREQGSDWSMGGWRGLGAPKGTPKPVVDKLLAAVERIVTGETRVRMGGEAGSEQNWPEMLKAQMTDGSWQLPPDFRKTLSTTDEELGKLLTSDTFASLTKSKFSPYDFPLILGGILVLSLIGIFIHSRRGQFQKPPSAVAGGKLHFVEIVVGIALYILLAETLGFILCGGVLLLVLMIRLGTRPAIALTVTVVLVPAIYFLFTQLGVSLPLGLLGS